MEVPGVAPGACLKEALACLQKEGHRRFEASARLDDAVFSIVLHILYFLYFLYYLHFLYFLHFLLLP